MKSRVQGGWAQKPNAKNANQDADPHVSTQMPKSPISTAVYQENMPVKFRT